MGIQESRADIANHRREPRNTPRERDAMTPDELKAERERIGMTKPQLAKALGVSTRTVQNWEAGEARIQLGVRQAMREIDGAQARHAKFSSRRLRELVDKLRADDPDGCYAEYAEALEDFARVSAKAEQFVGDMRSTWAAFDNM